MAVIRMPGKPLAVDPRSSPAMIDAAKQIAGLLGKNALREIELIHMGDGCELLPLQKPLQQYRATDHRRMITRHQAECIKRGKAVDFDITFTSCCMCYDCNKVLEKSDVAYRARRDGRKKDYLRIKLPDGKQKYAHHIIATVSHGPAPGVRSEVLHSGNNKASFPNKKTAVVSYVYGLRI
jgi:hypothetical protein